jgi:DNA-binding PadR family transcriptional regulator
LETSKLNENQEWSILTSETLEELHKRIIKSFLDLIILINLHNQNTRIGGYDVMGFIHEEFNTLLSAGTIYSTLYSLERDGLVKGEHTRKKKMYILTEKGKNKIKIISDSKPRILDLIEDLFMKKHNNKKISQ